METDESGIVKIASYVRKSFTRGGSSFYRFDRLSFNGRRSGKCPAGGGMELVVYAVAAGNDGRAVLFGKRKG